MPRCFVMQPFAGDEFDKRFDEIYKPAIEEAGFEPYRVDRDPGASIPIANVESGIKESAACFADISTDNPNVWFELGYAICANKPLCLVCWHDRDKFPFDVQHRKIIRYKRTSLSDFNTLRSNMVERLKALLETDTTIETLLKESGSIHTGDLSQLEFSALCVMVEDQESDTSWVSFFSVANAMERLGYTKIAARVAMAGLVEKHMLTANSVTDNDDGSQFSVYNVTNTGTKYVMANIDKIQLRKKGQSGNTFGRMAATLDENDIPF